MDAFQTHPSVFVDSGITVRDVAQDGILRHGSSLPF
jgi:hypothetical protein